MEQKLRTHRESLAYATDSDFQQHIDELTRTLSELMQASEAGTLHYGQVTQKVDGKGDLIHKIVTTWFDPNKSRNVRSNVIPDE